MWETFILSRVKNQGITTNNLLLQLKITTLKLIEMYKKLLTHIIKIQRHTSLNTLYRITPVNKVSLSISYLFFFSSVLLHYLFHILENETYFSSVLLLYLSIYSRTSRKELFIELFWASPSSMIVHWTVPHHFVFWDFFWYPNTSFGIPCKT